ncbi:3-carboxy-cis,cis-muconate cycloisomerase [Marivibrio halodurans]|uniref:3-carboxy-cis,cis-muconate cycloisomerase n=1 Tax=Marivibrio halodurans TaxID=2039722 RepID=A0A8J7S2N2_9PROT|nr:3-carboxy-cis,cis-muconate cycloisomerase [Marivibrio halodurans]MBP5857458.1 3-carboxy-cis,cis-muconate cycloisomerase [Marivibrio halodurans]
MPSVFGHSYLGDLFDDSEASEIWSAERQIKLMLLFEAAWSRSLGDAGVISDDDAEKAAMAIETFEPDVEAIARETARDGLPVPELVRQLRMHVGPLEGCVHRGATSQDVIDTALALTIGATLDRLQTRTSALDRDLDGVIARFGGRHLMAKTRMQAAKPITVADRVSVWRGSFAACADRIDGVRTRAVRLQFGGAVGDRNVLDGKASAVAAAMSRRLGLPDPGRAWHADRAGVVEFADLLSAISGASGKMGQDLCLMAQARGDELKLSAGGRSSAMPHKNNPILAELLVTLARFNATQVGAMHQALVHEQERSGAAWVLEWMVLPQMAEVSMRSLAAARELLSKIEALGA